MRLTKAAAHAALAMAYLATRSGDGPTQARQVAKHLSIPTDSALKILQTLAPHRLVQSHLGRSGGYRMHLRPESVSVLQIVESIEGPISPNMSFHDVCGSVCPSMGMLKLVCQQVAQGMRSELSRFTVADLAGAPRESLGASEPLARAVG